MTGKEALPKATSSDLLGYNAAMNESSLKTDTTICFLSMICVCGTSWNKSLEFIFMGVWEYIHWSFHGIRPVCLMCKLGPHEQLLKEDMKTPVLGMLGIWLSWRFSHSIHRLCCPQTYPKINDFSLLVLIHLQGKTWPLPNPSQVCSGGCSKM